MGRGLMLTSDIPEGQLSRLSAFIAARLGLRIPKARWPELEHAINAAARELEIKDGQSCIEWLLSSSPDRKQAEILAAHLTVGETYFFRDKRLFMVLKKSILPELIRLRRKKGKRLRIWSAGCSTGEEPYSIAILLTQLLPDIDDWNITITATDINTQFLQKAMAGVYGQWSFRDVQPGIKEKYFRKKDDCFVLLPRIREMVTFSFLNMMDGIYPSLVNHANALDIIFCRNVLMYLIPELGNRIVRHFYRTLVNGGLLIVSAGESFSPFFSRFTAIRAPGALLYRKESPPRASFPGPPDKSRLVFKAAFTPVAAQVLEPKIGQNTPLLTSPVVPLQPPAAGPVSRDLYQEASALFQKGRYAEAVQEIGRLLYQKPADARGPALLARIYADQGRLGQALEWCDKAIAEEGLQAGYHYLRATILRELGRKEEAVVSLRRTLYLDSSFIPAHVTLGNISHREGRRKEAMKHFKNALSLLKSKHPEELPSELEGINVERLTEIVQAMQQAETGGIPDE